MIEWYQYLGKEKKDCIELFDTLDFSSFLKGPYDLYDIIDHIEYHYGKQYEEITGGLLFNQMGFFDVMDYLQDRYDIEFIEHIIYLKKGTGKKKNEFNS